MVDGWGRLRGGNDGRSGRPGRAALSLGLICFAPTAVSTVNKLPKPKASQLWLPHRHAKGDGKDLRFASRGRCCRDKRIHRPNE